MPDAIKDFDIVLVPMQMEAFVLNLAVCGTGKDGDDTARIVPITQPNYAFLRLDNMGGCLSLKAHRCGLKPPRVL